MNTTFSVSNLRCEYMENPLGIDVIEPRLSWLIHSERRGTMQPAYQIRALDADTGLIAKASYDSVHGRIESSWNIENGCMYWEVCVPPHTTATAFIPAKSGCTVKESGNLLEKAEGISSIQMGDNAVICELGSGKYRFTVEPFSYRIKQENNFQERIIQ